MSVPFGDKLSALCAMELAAAHGDEERAGAMIERLVNSLAFTIAITTQGDPDSIQKMLTGVESYLYETTANHRDMGEFMSAAKSRKRP